MLIKEPFKHLCKTLCLVVTGFSLMTAMTLISANAASFNDLSRPKSALTVPLVVSLPTSHNILALADTATATTPITGKFGSSDWSLADGTLTIGPGDFASHSSATSPWAAYSSQITKIEITGPVTFNTYAVGLFAGLSNLTQIDGLEKVDTSRTISIDDLFDNDSQLTNLTGIENWKTGNLQTMEKTFFATALTGTLDLSNWDVSSLTSAYWAFTRAGGLDANGNRLFNLLDLSGWNFKAAKVNLSGMGYLLQANAINTTGWGNTSHITSMSQMFFISRIQKIDMSSFDMRQLSYSAGTLQQMFIYAGALKEIKLGPYSKLDGTALPSVTENNKYTGFWQNIGTGTVTNPNGNQVLTTAQLVTAYDGTKTQATDTFVWQPKPSQPVTVNYVDKATNKAIQPATTITGAIEDPFTITPPSISGYSYQGTQDDALLTGAISGDAQTVTLLYQQQPTEGSITVNYLDTDGQPIADPQTMTGQLGSDYTLTPKSIAGYKFQAGDLTGKFTTGTKSVTLTYQKVTAAQGSVTVNYVDDHGKVLAPAKTLTGDVDTPFTISQPGIAGYTFHHANRSLAGTFTGQPQTVTLIYQATPAKLGSVVIKYQTADGQSIAADRRLTGTLEATYTITPPAFKQYKYQKATGKLAGKFSTTTPTIVLTYTKQATDQGQVTVHYLDLSGQQLAAVTTLTGPFASPYTTTAKSIAGYTYVKTSGQPTGKFSSEAQNVSYYYQKQAGSNNLSQLTGQDYTMTVNGTTPTAEDFKAVGKNKAGQTVAVKVDLSQADLKKVGTYQVTLRTDDGQTLVVKLHVIAATSGGSTAGDKLNPGNTQKPDNSVTSSLKQSTKPATSIKPQKRSKELPATGESASRFGLILGLITLIAIGFKTRRRF